jgi:predicted CxxxxCH...CXXCH cytochrome family protein
MLRTLHLFALGLALAGCFPAKPVTDDTSPEADADTDADADSDTDTDPGFHEAGWAAGDAHGLAAKLQESDCGSCHGEDLLGGSSGIGCDGCHPDGWRADCVFCHGGTNNSTGAPPLDMDGSASGISFSGHDSHVEGLLHSPWGCEQCHPTPSDILEPGHLFVDDDSAGEAEVDMGGGLAPQGAYQGAGSCADVYCHGDGAGQLGTVSVGQMAVACGSCHAGAAQAQRLSGVHGEHQDAGAECADCHRSTALGSDALIDVAPHVDGDVDVALVAGMSWDPMAESCEGSCHDTEHGGATWDGQWHGEGWDDHEQHGAAAKQQSQDCASCHGSDLLGGSSGQSCDACHESGWRTDCVRCHGGTDNSTGAPPVDIDGASSGISYPEHSEHVSRGTHAAWSCVQCHEEPDDVLSEGHLFVGDSTPGLAELSFGGLSPAGGYAGGGSCNNLYCHGDGDGSLGNARSGSSYDCGDCHGDASSSRSLSGEHQEHIEERLSCDDCHGDTVSGNDRITGPDNHVNGGVELSMSGVSWNGSSCDGYCHGENHRSERW